jgi:hypothetical protein
VKTRTQAPWFVESDKATKVEPKHTTKSAIKVMNSSFIEPKPSILSSLLDQFAPSCPYCHLTLAHSDVAIELAVVDIRPRWATQCLNCFGTVILVANGWIPAISRQEDCQLSALPFKNSIETRLVDWDEIRMQAVSWEESL